MKKIKYLIISLLIILLLPKSVFAANSPILNKDYEIKVRILNFSEVGISIAKNDENIGSSIDIYEAYDSSNDMYFHIYSLEKKVDANIKSIKCQNSSSKKEKEELLNSLLSNTNQVNLTNSEDILKMNNQKQLLNMVATQILVWEIISGGRTSFEKIEPTNSYYFTNLVNINRNNTFSSGLPSLYDVYSSIVKNVNEKNKNKSTNSKDNPYVLYYNVNNERYQNVISALNYDTLTTNYDIKNNTPIKLSSSSNGLLAYTSVNNYFTDVKAIPIEQKKGSTNTDLQNFYYFTSSGNEFVLASKADVVPQNLYFKCAQGDFKLLTLEGSGRSILGATYQIKNSNGETLKFVTATQKNTFTYDQTGTGAENIVYEHANTYVLNDIPDGEYSIIQTAIPMGNSFPVNEEDRTIKIKIDNGKFYSFNKILGKYEENQMRVVKFTNYTSKVYLLDSEFTSAEGDTYNIINSSSEKVLVYGNTKNEYYQTFSGSGLIETQDLTLNSNTKRISIYGLPTGDYKIVSNRRTEDKERSFSIKNNSTIGDSIFISFDTKKYEVNFFKLDENGKYLDGGLFSLRVLENSNSSSSESTQTDESDASTDNYVDIALSKEEGKNSYKVAEDGQEYTFSVENGSVNISGLAAGKTYRFLELTPPDGYSLFDANRAYVDVSVDANGYATSTPYMINKQILATTDASSTAELILSIRTGKELIKYGLIVLGVLVFVTLLIVIKKKFSKGV